MGMFDKDKEIGAQLTTIFEKKEEFVLWNATVDETPVSTEIGPAKKTRLTVSRLNSDDPAQFEVTTLGSAIADKAAAAESSDFPAVVYWTTVRSNYGGDATVLQFLRDYPHGT